MTASKTVKKILIVDDTEVIRNLLSELLASEGYEVLCANDGIEAIPIIQSEEIDLVFCDIHMPRRNGLDTLMCSKALKPNLLFVMTDSLPDEMAEAAQQYGAIKCISKPFDLEEIRDSLLRAESIYSKGINVESTS
ncbi:MAG: response regulator [Candidatus Zixiibacteriota bacterium]